MTNEEASVARLKCVEDQIRLCELGVAEHIGCPYCGRLNTADQEFVCCHSFAAAVEAVLQRKESGDLIRHAGRIAENLMKDTIQ